MIQSASAQTCPGGPTARATDVYIVLPTAQTACCIDTGPDAIVPDDKCTGVVEGDINFPIEYNRKLGVCGNSGRFADFQGTGSCEIPVVECPVPPFVLGQLGLGSTDPAGDMAALMARVEELVDSHLCEFDVRIHVTDTYPSPTSDRWIVVAIGGDRLGLGTLGQALGLAANPGQEERYRFARVWMRDIESWANPVRQGPTCASGHPIPSLAPGVTVACNASFPLDDADFALGERTFVVAGSGLDGATDVSAGSREVEALTDGAALTLRKFGIFNDEGATPGIPEAGETVSYRFLVANTGGVVISNVSIENDDRIPQAAVDCSGSSSIPTINPGEIHTCNGTYTLLAADVGGFELDNAGGNATGTDPGAATVASNEDPATTILLGVASLHLALFSVYNDVDSSGTLNSGDTVLRQYLATNTGNAALTNVTLSDLDAPSMDVVENQLVGANSTVERWARVIAGLTVHEAGHTVGIAQHGSACPLGITPSGPEDCTVSGNQQCTVATDEDPVSNHLMALPPCFSNTTAPVDFRHFSDTSLGILAPNVNLAHKTLTNWDFINPNNRTATELHLTLLSPPDPLDPSGPLTVDRFYTGSYGPWTETIPFDLPLDGTETIGTTVFNRYILVMDDPKATDWTDKANTTVTHPAGQVPPGAAFHVGAAWPATNIIVWKAQLRGPASCPTPPCAIEDLPLSPRVMGFDSGVFNHTGMFGVNAFNPDPAAGDLVLRNLQVRLLPRMLELDEMVDDGELRAITGEEIVEIPRQAPTPGGSRDATRGAPVGDRVVIDGMVVDQNELRIARDSIRFPVSRVAVDRFIDIPLNKATCLRNDPGFPADRWDFCEGYLLSLFPATYVYVTGTVVQENASVWDPDLGAFVTRDLESNFYRQFAGRIVDYNENGIDDLIEIREGTETDSDGDGVVDSVDDDADRAFNLRLGIADGDDFDPGVSLQAGLELLTAPGGPWEFILGYHDLGSGRRPGVDIWQVSVNRRIYFAPSHPLSPFVNGGVGLYALDPGSTEAGINVGIGLKRPIRPNLALEAGLNYHEIDDAEADFWALQIGLSWRLQ